ncbi:MAG: helix-turn-helix domain-containing protein [Bacillota bacterium]|nr:helix-turn-helix domain-containing protein [Bacillota bacterium]
MLSKNNEKRMCPVNVTQNILAGKWKLMIIWLLSMKTRRFNELQRILPEVSRGVLAQQLRELENDSMVHREVYREVPPKVEYSLTEIGRNFLPVLTHIMEWGTWYIKNTSVCNSDLCLENSFPCSKCLEAAQANEKNTYKV